MLQLEFRQVRTNVIRCNSRPLACPSKNMIPYQHAKIRIIEVVLHNSEQ